MLGLSYTWQQIEIFKLAYQENSRNKAYKELLDRNHYLRYNLTNLKSSSYLGNKLLGDNTNFEIPRRSQMLTLALPKENVSGSNIFNQPLRTVAGDAWPISIIKSYINKQAQAQDLNNQENRLQR